MPLVIRKPHLRFEHTYGRHLTVLEGAELGALTSRFFWHLRRRIRKNDGVFMSAFIEAACLAYKGLYDKQVLDDMLDEQRLSELKDPDARKLDLFYRAMLLIFCEARYPNENWDKTFRRKRSMRQILNDVVQLKPNIAGIGLDLNKLYDYLTDNDSE